MSTSGLEAVFLASRTKLIRFLASLGASDPEDILHELWLRIASSRPGPVGAPLSYLYRAAHNLMIDQIRSTHQASLRDQAWHEVLPGAGVGQSEAPTADRILIGREQLRSLDAVLQTVGDRAAQVFRRHRLDGVEQRTIAAELGISVSTVEADLRKVYKALLELKKRFDEA